MKGRAPWGKADYARALKGEGGAGYPAPGLRSLVDGFKAADGYDLRYIAGWTPYQRRKVRESVHKVRLLEGQPKRIVRPRTKESLRVLQGAFHEEVRIPGLKVAFVPYVEPARPKGTKRRPVKVKIRAGTITISDGYTERHEAVFNRLDLVKDTKAEVKRAVKDLGPNAKLLAVQVGKYQTLNGWDLRTITTKVEQWMMKYNGKTAFERGDAKFGEKPSNHNWRNWFYGVVGYVPAPGVRIDTVQRMLIKGFEEKKRTNKARDKKRRKKQSAAPLLKKG